MIDSLLAKIGGARALLITGLLCLLVMVIILVITSDKPGPAPDIFFWMMWPTLGSLALFWMVGSRRQPIDYYGSARWENASDASKAARNNAQSDARGATVLLGYLDEGKRGPPFAWKTDKHVLIVASSRSGKGTDLIIPNLLNHDGSVFVLDPKGENARATARHRSTFSTVHCLDPWGLTGQPRANFNPLARLCKPENAADVATDSAALASALVLPDNSQNRYFTDTARQLIEGLIAYAVTEENLRPVADLKLVRTLLTQHIRPTLEAMAKTTTGPDSIRSNAGRMLAMGEREFGQILSSAVTETAFLDDPRLQESLSGQNSGQQVDFSRWGTEKMSVYVCLPAPYFKTFNRWLRLLVTSALDETMRLTRPPPQSIMFILDELATLERMQPVENAIGLAAGFGIQVWSIFQDLGQIKDLYDKRYSSFVGNAGIRLFFGTQEPETAKIVSDMLGNETWRMEITQGSVVSDIRHGGRPLLMPDEVMRLPENTMIAFITARHPLWLHRLPYYKNPQFKGLWDDPR